MTSNVYQAIQQCDIGQFLQNLVYSYTNAFRYVLPIDIQGWIIFLSTLTAFSHPKIENEEISIVNNALTRHRSNGDR